MSKPEFTLNDMLRIGAENSRLKAKLALFEFNIKEIRRDLYDGDQQAPGRNVEVREELVVRAIERLDALLRVTQ